MSSTLRSISSTVQSVAARTVAERGWKLMHVISPNRSPAPSRAIGLSYGRSTGASIGIQRVPCLFRARVLLAIGEQASDPAEPAARRALLLDVLDRRRDEHLDRALEDVERRRSELAFAADDVARLEVALDDRALVQLEERAGHALEHRQVQELFRAESRRRRRARCRRRACWSARRSGTTPCTRRTTRRSTRPSGR